MSIVIETFLICDGNLSTDCEENYGVDQRNYTGHQQRIWSRGAGWKTINNKDYCPACLKELKKIKA